MYLNNLWALGNAVNLQTTKGQLPMAGILNSFIAQQERIWQRVYRLIISRATYHTTK